MSAEDSEDSEDEKSLDNIANIEDAAATKNLKMHVSKKNLDALPRRKLLSETPKKARIFT